MSSNVCLDENIDFWTAFLAIDLGKYTIAGVDLTPKAYFNDYV